MSDFSTVEGLAPFARRCDRSWRYLMLLVSATAIWSTQAIGGVEDAGRLTELWNAPNGVQESPEATEWMRSLLEQAQSGLGGCSQIDLPAIPLDRPTRVFSYRVDQSASPGKPVMFVLQEPITELVLVKAAGPRGCIWIFASGRSLPFQFRNVISPFPNAQLPDLVPGSVITVLIQDRKTIRPWIKLANRSDFERESTLVWMGLAGYLSVLIVVMVIAIVIDAPEDKRIASAYIFYVLALMLWLVQNFGIGAAWLPIGPGSEYFPIIQGFSVALVVLGIGVAVIEFLQLDGRTRTFVQAAVALGFLGFASSAWANFGYRLGSLVLATLALIIVVMLAKRSIRKDMSQCLFTIGFAATVTGGGLQAHTVINDGANVGPLSVFAFSLGNLVQSVFWLAALGVRIRSHRRAMEDRLVYEASHDIITGLPNRALLNQHLQKRLDQGHPGSEAKFGLLFMDLDRFKVVNDSLGHTTGDQLLSSFSRVVEGIAPERSTVARFGGDEFVILIEDSCTEPDLEQYGAQILDCLRTPLQVGEREIRINASIGMILIDNRYKQVEEVLRDADTALHAAKRSGRGHLQLFEQSLRSKANSRFELELDLAASIQGRHFELFYQPIVHIADRRHAGFEALVRWRHPIKGMIGPIEFISIAEETGLIRDLGHLILQLAIEKVGEWKHAGLWKAGWYVSINLSGEQLQNLALVDEIHKMLDANDVLCSDIRIELTETAVISNIDVANCVLPELRAQGIALCMDDFGTGYSSLSYLRKLPFNVLKIDKSFVDEIEREERQLTLVKTVITMAESMNLLVVAEGIEDAKQLALLRNLRCGYGQGYHISKPMPADLATEWLRRHLSDSSQAG